MVCKRVIALIFLVKKNRSALTFPVWALFYEFFLLNGFRYFFFNCVYYYFILNCFMGVIFSFYLRG